MVMMLTEKLFARHCALKVAAFVLPLSARASEAFVAAGGLKPLFPCFMGVGSARVDAGARGGKAGARERKRLASLGKKERKKEKKRLKHRLRPLDTDDEERAVAAVAALARYVVIYSRRPVVDRNGTPFGYSTVPLLARLRLPTPLV